MNCFLCGKKIGLLRSLSDKQYCSAAHRKESGQASARALRDEEDSETWAAERSRIKKGAVAKSTASAAGQAGAMLAFLGVGGAMVAVLLMGGGQGAGPKTGGAFSGGSAATGKTPSVVSTASDALGNWIRGVAPVTLQHSFRGGSLASALTDWSSITLYAASGKIDDPRDWIGKGRTTASLRLWKRSTTMRNYHMEFQGRLEKTSLSWAVRASDAGNYYATKLALIKAGPLNNAGLIRYTMVNGRETDRTQVPLPVTLQRGVDYRVSVTVQGDRFLTYLNGKVIGSMVDKRLTRGGVGFFDDDGDPQKVAWVSVSERDSFFGRLLANFALFLIPAEPQQ
jgi:hypothetical protein